jgi:predicted RNA-binding protein with PIN domain
MSAHEYGVEALRILIGKSEDISRFDYGLVVAHDDVESELINRVRPSRNGDRARYDELRRANKALILWAWSRRPDQIEFTGDATTAVLRLVPHFSEYYSSSIPLVQRENFGEKLAKVATATAARTFSSDETGQKLIVTKGAVVYAAKFLQRIYNASNMAYDAYSQMETLTEKMADRGETARFFESFGVRVPYIIEVMMKKKVYTQQDIQLIFDTDQVTAREVINELLRLRVLKPHGGRLVKTADAIRWFKEKYQQIQIQVSRDGSE